MDLRQPRLVTSPRDSTGTVGTRPVGGGEAERRRLELELELETETLVSTYREEPLGSSEDDVISRAGAGVGAASAGPPPVAAGATPPPPRGRLLLPTAQMARHSAGLPGAVPVTGSPGTQLHFMFAHPCGVCGSTNLRPSFPVYRHKDVLVTEFGQLVPGPTLEVSPPPATLAPPWQVVTTSRPMLPAQRPDPPGQQIDLQISPTGVSVSGWPPMNAAVRVTSMPSHPVTDHVLRPRFNEPLPWEPVVDSTAVRALCPIEQNCPSCSPLLTPRVTPPQLFQAPPLAHQPCLTTPVRGRHQVASTANQQQQQMGAMLSQQRQQRMGTIFEQQQQQQQQSEFLASARMIPQLTLVQSAFRQQPQTTLASTTYRHQPTTTTTTSVSSPETAEFSTHPGESPEAAPVVRAAADSSDSVSQPPRRATSRRGILRRR